MDGVGGSSARPRRDREYAVLLAEVARRRRDDGSLGQGQLAARLNRRADVFFTDEVERSLTGLTAVRLV